MPILKILTLAFIMLEASGCAGIDHGCTEVGCSDGLQIALKKAATPWEAGKYTVEVDADGKKATCTITLPATADPVCSSSTLMVLDLSPVDTAAAKKGIEKAQIFVAATKVKLTVSRDGMQVASQDYTPTYATSTPNGPDCAPTCHEATADLAVP